ncbi:hypothetical protein G5I_07715 [Acromyrmex echinatior]|uniref:Uncharacterized protein n=1 Tax=Acromyrmex echinatior TaxID=103372 RepID=F4WPJ8_ACREC|nr:hypothetical protein G5I_07715 [Acromyrmex echinatior]
MMKGCQTRAMVVVMIMVRQVLAIMRPLYVDIFYRMDVLILGDAAVGSRWHNNDDSSNCRLRGQEAQIRVAHRTSTLGFRKLNTNILQALVLICAQCTCPKHEQGGGEHLWHNDACLRRVDTAMPRCAHSPRDGSRRRLPPYGSGANPTAPYVAPGSLKRKPLIVFQERIGYHAAAIVFAGVSPADFLTIGRANNYR